GYFHPSFFKVHGGLLGELQYFATSTLFQRAGAYIAFICMLGSGLLLLTGTSISRVVALAAEGVRRGSSRLRVQTHDLARALSEERERARVDALGGEHLYDELEEDELEEDEEEEEAEDEEEDEEEDDEELDSPDEQDTLTDLDPLEAIGEQAESRSRAA